MDSLKDKVSLITGGSRGIGRAIALGLAAAGSDVVINYRERKGEADEVVIAAAHLGVRAMAMQADMAKPETVRALIGEAARSLGRVDILVNNAAVARPRPLGEVSLQDWEETMNVNLRSAFIAAEEALPAMRKRHWGRLIFIASTAANIGGIIGPHYASSKAGLMGLMHWYAAHLASEGITSNTVSPGLIDTEMIAANERAQPSLLPVGRSGRPEEVAEVVLAVARNGYMTGQTINVNGGSYMT